MSTRLADEGIRVLQGYDPAHLQPPPDLVIVGNACTPTHPEARYAREQGLVQLSFPEALAHFFLQDRRSLVVAGTHGKTTTTGILTHLFTSAGREPGYLVGGVMQNTGASYRAGTGPHFIVEGDEYDSAYFDKRPKFIHYQPQGAIVTSMELDHTDIYPDWKSYREAFEHFAGLVPDAGVLVLCGDHDEVRSLAGFTGARVRTYGLSPANQVTAADHRATSAGQSFTLLVDGEPLGQFLLPLHGRHNLSNTLAACALALEEGVSVDHIAQGLSTYRGMRRRQEIRGVVNDILIIDDVAHHPTAVRETLYAMRQAYPERRLIAVFEPRTNTSRRKDFQAAYVEAFEAAQVVFLSTPPFRHNDDPANFLDVSELVASISAGGAPAFAFDGADALLPHLLDHVRPGDVIVIMSNGGFGGLHDRLLQHLNRENALRQ
jgi:UDP-N-acetylmuramate: L-alanyl-gamma-D-glutamyl-meso-diaminopimelate ligase